MARGAAAVDLDGKKGAELVVSAGTRAYVLAGATGDVVLRFEAARMAGDRLERISSAPLVGDFDGDGAMEMFVVCGRGYSGPQKSKNGGRAYAIRLGGGETDGGWRTFRGNLKRTGTAP